MTNSIQNLLNLAKVDNSRETFDKLAKALEVAGVALDKIDWRCDEPTSSYARDALNEIQTITENGGII